MSEVDNQPATDSVATPSGSTPAAAETTPASATGPTGETPADTLPAPERPAAGLQKAINRLTRQRGEAERRADRLATEVEELRKQVAQVAQTRSVIRPEDFPNYDAFIDAKAEQKAKAVVGREIEAMHRSRSQDDSARQMQGLHDAFLERATEQAAEADIDLDGVMETLRQAPLLSPTVLGRLAESDRAARLAEFLAENPAELDRVSRLGPTLANKALEKIEAKFGPAASPARSTTKAPPPVPTVGGRAVTSPDPQKMSIEEYAQYWTDREEKRAKLAM